MEQYPYSELDESQLMNTLQESLKDASREQHIKRISYLEEILRRTRSGSFENLDNSVKIALDTAIKILAKFLMISDIYVILTLSISIQGRCKFCKISETKTPHCSAFFAIFTDESSSHWIYYLNVWV